MSDSQSIVIDARYLLADPAEGVFFAGGRVVVDAGAIVAVGHAADVPVPVGAERRTFDLVMPGLINAHHHAYLRSPARAGCPDMALEPWLVGLNLLPDGGGARLATLAASIRQLKAGVTSVIHSDGPGPAETYEYNVGERLEAYRQTGQRVAFALGYADQQAWVYAPDGDFLQILPSELRHSVEARMRATAGLSPHGYAAAFEALAETLPNGGEAPRMRLLLGPLSPIWTSRAALEMMADLLRRHPRAGLHTHFLESIHQRQYADTHFKSGLASHLAELGLLSENTSLAHGVWTSDNDLGVLAETGATIVHNPASNLRLRCGLAPVLDMRERGVNVALGQDASALDDDDDFLREARLAWQLHFRPGVHAPSLAARDVFELIYRGGARALGLPGQVGLVAPGARADLIGLTLQRTGEPPDPTPGGVANHVLQWLGSQDVGWVMVDGVEIVRDGRMCGIDEDALQHDIEQALGSARPGLSQREMFSQLQAYVRAYYADASPPVSPPFYSLNGG